MHGMAPRVLFGQAWWDVVRKQAYASTGYRCAACGIPKSEAKYHHWLEGHELYEIDYPKGRMKLMEIVPLCHSCHNYIHSGRMQALVDKGEMKFQKMKDILCHGDAILKAAKLSHPKPPKKIARWEDWRFELEDGELFEPIFPTRKAWMNHFHPGWDDGVELDEFEQEF